MKVIKKVIVKQVFTENRKQLMLKQYIDKKKQLEKEIKQLEFQLHKKIKANKNNFDYQAKLKTSFQKEIKDRNEKRKIIDFQVDQLNELHFGTEIIEQTIDTLVDIQVGDDWNSFLIDSEIIVKDGIIIEIRKGGK